jgi:hypothetical protein
LGANVPAAGVTSTRVTLGAGWSGGRDPSKYAGGMVEWRTVDGTLEIRTIIRIENGGLTLLLGGPTRGLLIGADVDVILGCNHKAGISAQPDGDCLPLHNNIQNFGGQPWIPFKNPIGLVNNYY